MTAIVLFAAMASLLLGVAAGRFILLPFDKLVVNTFTRAIVVSLIAMIPMFLGGFVVRSVADLTGSARELGLAFFVGITVGAIWYRLKEEGRRR